MKNAAAWVSFAFIITVSGTAQPRSQSGKPASPSKSQTPVGIWEADDGAGGAVGINLWENASSSYHGGPLPPGDDGRRAILQVGIYQRGPLKVRCGEENFYDMGWRGAQIDVSTSYTAERLIIRSPAKIAGDMHLDLDVKHHSTNDSWIGRFHRGNFDKQLTLHRATDRPLHDQEICTAPGAMPSSHFP